MLNEQEIRKRVKALKGFYMDLINFAVVNIILILIWFTFDKTGAFGLSMLSLFGDSFYSTELSVWESSLLFFIVPLFLLPIGKRKKLEKIMRRRAFHRPPPPDKSKKKK